MGYFFARQQMQNQFAPKSHVNRNSRIPESMKLASWRMRDAPTSAEEILWEELRLKRLDGLRFRRQHVLGSYIADFYCHQAKLVVEVDGSSHDGRLIEDGIRDSLMASMGMCVMRFRNEEVFADIEAVKKKILSVVTGMFPQPSERNISSNAPLRGGRG